MNKHCLFILGVIILLLPPKGECTNGALEDPAVQVTLRAERHKVTMGDPIPFEITINNNSFEDVGVVEQFESEWLMGEPGRIILNSALIFTKDVRGFKINIPQYIRIRATHNGNLFQIPTVRKIWFGAPYTIQLKRIEGKELVNMKYIIDMEKGFDAFPKVGIDSFYDLRNLVEGEYRFSIIMGVFKIADLEEMEKGFPYNLNPEDPDIFQNNIATYRKHKNFYQSRIQVIQSNEVQITLVNNTENNK